MAAALAYPYTVEDIAYIREFSASSIEGDPQQVKTQLEAIRAQYVPAILVSSRCAMILPTACVRTNWSPRSAGSNTTPTAPTTQCRVSAKACVVM